MDNSEIPYDALCSRSYQNQRLTSFNRIPRLDQDLFNHAAHSCSFCADCDLKLHRFQYDDHLILAQCVTLFEFHFPYISVQRSFDGDDGRI